MIILGCHCPKIPGKDQNDANSRHEKHNQFVNW